MKTYLVVFKTGVSLTIKAHRFEVTDGQHGLVVRFFGEGNVKNEDIYVPAAEVVCVAPEEDVLLSGSK